MSKWLYLTLSMGCLVLLGAPVLTAGAAQLAHGIAAAARAELVR